MVEVEIAVDDAGVLRFFRASGHAGQGRNGNDIVCAAVSVLVRTAVRVLSGRAGITIDCRAPEPGFLEMEADYREEGRGFLSASGEFLVEGLSSLAEEFPENCSLSIRRI